jgi:hypothetical protein
MPSVVESAIYQVPTSGSFRWQPPHRERDSQSTVAQIVQRRLGHIVAVCMMCGVCGEGGREKQRKGCSHRTESPAESTGAASNASEPHREGGEVEPRQLNQVRITKELEVGHKGHLGEGSD